jgi:hypothetical protein
MLYTPRQRENEIQPNVLSGEQLSCNGHDFDGDQNKRWIWQLR